MSKISIFDCWIDTILIYIFMIMKLRSRGIWNDNYCWAIIFLIMRNVLIIFSISIYYFSHLLAIERDLREEFLRVDEDTLSFVTASVDGFDIRIYFSHMQLTFIHELWRAGWSRTFLLRCSHGGGAEWWNLRTCLNQS